MYSSMFISTKTIGQIVDEMTIHLIKVDKGVETVHETKSYTEAIEGYNTCYLNELKSINAKIWDLIDYIMKKRSWLCLLINSFKIARTAIMVQRLNKQRSDLVNLINEQNHQRSLGEKVYGHSSS